MLPPFLEPFATLALVIFGLIVGSFLNVVIWRVPRGESIVWPGSHCPHCGKPIAAFDNVPVLAWLWLRGRCRQCKGPISMRYPVVEAVTGALTYVFVRHTGFTWLLPFHLVFLYMGIALALIDLDTFLLPFSMTLPLIPIGIASGYFDPERGLVRAAIGAGVGWALIVLIGKVAELVLKKEAMGGGDAWLMGGIGAYTGPFLLFVALFLASIQGAVLGMVLLWWRRRHPPAAPEKPEAAKAAAPTGSEEEEEWEPDPTAVPFGPFLVLGALECILWGNNILEALNLRELELFR